MSTSGISSSLLSQIASSSSYANQFVTDLNQVSQDVQSGNLSAAQQDYVTLSQDALNGATASTPTTSTSGITTSLLSNITSSPNASTAFTNSLNQLGTDLQNGDLASAQGDLLNLDSTAQSSASPTTTASTASSSTSSSDTAALIRATLLAIRAGDTSAGTTSLSELASLSTNSAGATAISQDSGSYGSSSATSSLDTLA